MSKHVYTVNKAAEMQHNGESVSISKHRPMSQRQTFAWRIVLTFPDGKQDARMITDTTMAWRIFLRAVRLTKQQGAIAQRGVRNAVFDGDFSGQR